MVVVTASDLQCTSSPAARGRTHSRPRDRGRDPDRHRGIIAPNEDAARAVRYLTKDVGHGYSEVHIDRLHGAGVLPCSPECPNWLRLGVQPRKTGPGLRRAGAFRGHLGIGDRRVRVSRHWSDKTLKQHRADRAAVVRAVPTKAGVEAPITDRMSTDVIRSDGRSRYLWRSLAYQPSASLNAYSAAIDHGPHEDRIGSAAAPPAKNRSRYLPI